MTSTTKDLTTHTTGHVNWTRHTPVVKIFLILNYIVTNKGYLSASQTLQEIASQPITLHQNVEEVIANKDEILFDGFPCNVEGCEKKCKSELGLEVHLAWHKKH